MTATERMRCAAIAARLQREGLTSRAIAAQMGVAPSTVRGWLSDPSGTRARTRKASYRGRCRRCGADTSANAPGRPRSTCPACRAELSRRWTRELIEQRVHQWHSRYDEWPRASDWHSTRAREKGGEALRRWAEGIWPPASTVTRHFGRFENVYAQRRPRSSVAVVRKRTAHERHL